MDTSLLGTKDYKDLPMEPCLTLGSGEEDEIAGFFIFSHIRMRGHCRLG